MNSYHILDILMIICVLPICFCLLLASIALYRDKRKVKDELKNKRKAMATKRKWS